MESNKSNQIVFTRYLYIKDEVEKALIISILDKKEEESLFWAYELYYSGFQSETFQLLWNIYFDFFASLNQSFESYFFKKEKEWHKTKSDTTIAIIVQNLLIRPFNTDVFMLLYFGKHNETDCIQIQLAKWIQEKDYLSITSFITRNNKVNVVELYETFLDEFHEISRKQTLLTQFKKIIKYKPHLITKIAVSRIIALFTKTQKKIKGRNLYMHVDENDIVNYKTYDGNEIRPYRVLSKMCLFNLNENNYLSLFQLTRNAINNKQLHDLYFYHWIFCASFSPIWLTRIKQYHGTVDFQKKNIQFESEDNEEYFYNKYNYEPDEQPLSIQNKNIPNIDSGNNIDNKSNITWSAFQKKYNTNGIIDVFINESFIGKILYD